MYLLLLEPEVLSKCAEQRCPQTLHFPSFGGDLGTNDVQVHRVPESFEDLVQVGIR